MANHEPLQGLPHRTFAPIMDGSFVRKYSTSGGTVRSVPLPFPMKPAFCGGFRWVKSFAHWVAARTDPGRVLQCGAWLQADGNSRLP
jgi:hypothetical protein